MSSSGVAGRGVVDQLDSAGEPVGDGSVELTCWTWWWAKRVVRREAALGLESVGEGARRVLGSWDGSWSRGGGGGGGAPRGRRALTLPIRRRRRRRR